MQNTYLHNSKIFALVPVFAFVGCSIAILRSESETIEKLPWHEIGVYSIADERSWQTFSFSNQCSDIRVEIGEPWGPHHMISVYSHNDIVCDDNLAMPYHAHGCPWNVIACKPTEQPVSEVRIFPLRNTSLLMRLDISNLSIIPKGDNCPADYMSGTIKLSVCQVDGTIWSWVYEHPVLRRYVNNL